MRILLFCWLLVILLSCDYPHKQKTNSSDIIISGRINGSHWRTIYLKTRKDVTERSLTLQFRPDSTETFIFKFSKAIPNNFRLEVGPNTFAGWLYPGDSVYLESTISSDNNEFIRQTRFAGKSADQYRYFQRKALNSLTDEIDDLKKDASNEDFKGFKSKTYEAYHLSLKRFREDTAELQLNEEFVVHELNQMKYYHLSDLAREPMLRKYLRFDSAPTPEGYYDFLVDVNYQDSTFKNSHQLYRFLSDAADALNTSEIPAKVGIPRFDAFLKGSLKFSDSLLKGTVKEIFESKCIDIYSEYDLNRFDSLVAEQRTKGYDNPILNYYEQLSDSLRSLKFRIDDQTLVYMRNSQGVNLLNQIKKYEFTYLNIWFIGCRGCAMDFEKQDYFVEKYGERIQFLNICTSEPGKRFDDYIAKYGATGIHLFDLNGSVTEQITVYPYHGLFNRSGDLVTNNVFRPIDPKLDKLLDSLVNSDI